MNYIKNIFIILVLIFSKFSFSQNLSFNTLKDITYNTNRDNEQVKLFPSNKSFEFDINLEQKLIIRKTPWNKYEFFKIDTISKRVSNTILVRFTFNTTKDNLRYPSNEYFQKGYIKLENNILYFCLEKSNDKGLYNNSLQVYTINSNSFTEKEFESFLIYLHNHD